MTIDCECGGTFAFITDPANFIVGETLSWPCLEANWRLIHQRRRARARAKRRRRQRLGQRARS